MNGPDCRQHRPAIADTLPLPADCDAPEPGGQQPVPSRLSVAALLPPPIRHTSGEPRPVLDPPAALQIKVPQHLTRLSRVQSRLVTGFRTWQRNPARRLHVIPLQ